MGGEGRKYGVQWVKDQEWCGMCEEVGEVWDARGGWKGMTWSGV